MDHRELLLDRMTELMSETMGHETGKIYHDFYELEDEEEIITGARSLLHEFMGPEMADRRVNEARKHL